MMRQPHRTWGGAQPRGGVAPLSPQGFVLLPLHAGQREREEES